MLQQKHVGSGLAGLLSRNRMTLGAIFVKALKATTVQVHRKQILFEFLSSGLRAEFWRMNGFKMTLQEKENNPHGVVFVVMLKEGGNESVKTDKCPHKHSH